MILIIDDDGFSRTVIRRILEDDGHDVVEAQDRPEGVELYRQVQPELVITDMRLPGVDGGEVIRNLRSIDDNAKVIAVSGAATFYNVDFFELAKQVGADAILRKLDPMERVVIEVNRILEKPAV